MKQAAKRKSISRLPALLVLSLLLAGCQAEVHGNLTENDVREIVTVLRNVGIDANRSGSAEGAYSVTVERSYLAKATSELARRGLPREKFGTLGEIFASDKLVSTPFEERVRFMHALNEELAGSITRIAGVVSARVHVMVPESSPIARQVSKPRASVFIYKAPEADLNSLVPTVKGLLVNSLDGLEYENVEVALFDAANAGTPELTVLPTASGMLTMLAMLAGILFALYFAVSKLRQILGVGRPTPAAHIGFQPSE